jgi:hypothetical protein
MLASVEAIQKGMWSASSAALAAAAVQAEAVKAAKRMAIIDVEALRRLSPIPELLRQLEMKPWMNQLTPGALVDDSILAAWSSRADIFAATSLLSKSIAAQLANARTAGQRIAEYVEAQYPQNWKSHGIRISQAHDLAVQDATVIAWIPTGQVLEALVASDSREERFAVLLDGRSAIVTDCQNELAKLSQADPHVRLACEALEAVDSGAASGAQALGANLIDSTLYRLERLAGEGTPYAPVRRMISEDSIVDLRYGGFIAFCAVAKATERWFPNRGYPAPSNFNRHVTAHGASYEQYTEAHAIQAVMLATALLIAEARGDI